MIADAPLYHFARVPSRCSHQRQGTNLNMPWEKAGVGKDLKLQFFLVFFWLAQPSVWYVFFNVLYNSPFVLLDQECSRLMSFTSIKISWPLSALKKDMGGELSHRSLGFLKHGNGKARVLICVYIYMWSLWDNHL